MASSRSRRRLSEPPRGYGRPPEGRPAADRRVPYPRDLGTPATVDDAATIAQGLAAGRALARALGGVTVVLIVLGLIFGSRLAGGILLGLAMLTGVPAMWIHLRTVRLADDRTGVLATGDSLHSGMSWSDWSGGGDGGGGDGGSGGGGDGGGGG